MMSDAQMPLLSRIEEIVSDGWRAVMQKKASSAGLSGRQDRRV